MADRMDEPEIEDGSAPLRCKLYEILTVGEVVASTGLGLLTIMRLERGVLSLLNSASRQPWHSACSGQMNGL